MLDLRRLADHIFENVTTTYYSIAPLTSLAGSAPGSYPVEAKTDIETVISRSSWNISVIQVTISTHRVAFV